MDPELQRVHAVADPIQGWLSPLEGELLYRLAKSCTGRGVIVEIGSYKGKSTVWLAQGSQAGAGTPVYAIDPHSGSPEYREATSGVVPDTFDDFRRNIQSANVAGTVFPIVSTSAQAAGSFQKPVELLFIDGSHEYENVLKDFELWFPKLIDGGVIAMHDSVLSPGPARVAKDLIYRSNRFNAARFIHSTTYALKSAQNSASERRLNRYRLLLRDMYALATKIPAPGGLRRAMGNALRRLQNA
jgi:MMP 1-O-methyltransferase